MGTLGVGILGAGSVTQGIHLPTLARLSELFQVRHIMDVSEDAAAPIARRVGARWSTSAEALLDDDEVDVVAVCSPHAFHAEHVIAACRKGKAAVLCEKPLATSRDEAERIAEVARATEVPVIVGAMHGYDPAWLAAREAWGDLSNRARLIRSSIVLPTNDRYEAWSTEVSTPATLPQRDLSTPEARAEAVSARLLGLAIHDLPLVRTFLPGWRDLKVVSAELVAPVGYAVLLEASGTMAQVVGSFRSHWLPEWELVVSADESILSIEFPPSYVHAGSATARLRSGAAERVFGDSDANGYEGEWRRLHALATGARLGTEELDAFVDDLAFAVLLAEKAGEHMRDAA